MTTNEKYTIEDFVDFTLKAYASTPQDRALHGWDPHVSVREEILKVLQSIKQGVHELSPCECWKIALVESETAGFCVSFMPKDQQRPPYGEIGLIGVFPEFRKKGIGYALVVDTHTQFRKSG